jgi:hypothetical membrane protein
MTTREPRLAERLIALVVAGVFILNYPLIGLFTEGARWFGVPALYLYLFGAWAALIALIALLSDRRGRHDVPADFSGRGDA